MPLRLTFCYFSLVFRTFLNAEACQNHFRKTKIALREFPINILWGLFWHPLHSATVWAGSTKQLINYKEVLNPKTKCDNDMWIGLEFR